ncbi:MAG TPA: hypoxanthine phosphoribosyltransferase [Anaeromyxobacteraceae bacterium]|jgi:hypoxanthine phosphoribosyltransferase
MAGQATRVEVLIPEERIRARVAELGREIARDHAGLPLTLVGVLRGGFVFLADLMRAVDLPLEVDFLGAASYGAGAATSGEVRITADLARPVAGRHVVLVEDVLDTGLTMRRLLDHLAARRPAGLRACALLEKPARGRVRVALDYRGFLLGDEFAVGYGLDLGEAYRNLPYLGAVRSEA